ncbi:MAG: hypothetical protein IT306_11780 [Chloroflexi bacterium]|nr:hypothetical protein [Chloroflexota bacterium]
MAALFPPPPPWLIEAPAGLRTTVTVERDADTHGRYHVRSGDDQWLLTSIGDAQASAEALVTTALAEQLRHRLLLIHAGAVSNQDACILFPGPSGSGKSTLVAALVASGMRCFGDDVVLYDRERQQCLPFVRSITLKAGSPTLLSQQWGQQIEEPAAARFGETPVTFLTPSADAWPAAPLPVRFVVVLERQRGVTAHLRQLSRIETLTLLLSQCFNHGTLGAAAVHAALDLLRGCACMALTYDDLGEAVRLVRRLS